MSMLIGYARVSKLDQNPELQLDALKEAKCDKIYVDYLTGAKADRPEWQELLLAPGGWKSTHEQHL